MITMQMMVMMVVMILVVRMLVSRVRMIVRMWSGN